MSITRLKALTVGGVALVALCGAGVGAPVHGQTIEGTLLEVDSERPISLGLVIMMTEAGDSVTSAVTNSNGYFSVTSDEPGSFILISSAFGFKETRDGIFDLGPGSSMTIEFRVGAEAMPIEGILVDLQRPSIEHRLISNGFVRRLQRGNGFFITPYDIERSSATQSTDLFRGLPGVSVRAPQGGVNRFSGETVQFLSANGYCTPTTYLDGIRMTPTNVTLQPLSAILSMTDIDAVEIYRRPSEVPIEYDGTAVQVPGETGPCGVLVIWTKNR